MGCNSSSSSTASGNRHHSSDVGRHEELHVQQADTGTDSDGNGQQHQQQKAKMLPSADALTDADSLDIDERKGSEGKILSESSSTQNNLPVPLPSCGGRCCLSSHQNDGTNPFLVVGHEGQKCPQCCHRHPHPHPPHHHYHYHYAPEQRSPSSLGMPESLLQQNHSQGPDASLGSRSSGPCSQCGGHIPKTQSWEFPLSEGGGQGSPSAEHSCLGQLPLGGTQNTLFAESSLESGGSSSGVSPGARVTAPTEQLAGARLVAVGLDELASAERENQQQQQQLQYRYEQKEAHHSDLTAATRSSTGGAGTRNPLAGWSYSHPQSHSPARSQQETPSGSLDRKRSDAASVMSMTLCSTPMGSEDAFEMLLLEQERGESPWIPAQEPGNALWWEPLVRQQQSRSQRLRERLTALQQKQQQQDGAGGVNPEVLHFVVSPEKKLEIVQWSQQIPPARVRRQQSLLGKNSGDGPGGEEDGKEEEVLPPRQTQVPSNEPPPTDGMAMTCTPCCLCHSPKRERSPGEDTGTCAPKEDEEEHCHEFTVSSAALGSQRKVVLSPPPQAVATSSVPVRDSGAAMPVVVHYNGKQYSSIAPRPPRPPRIMSPPTHEADACWSSRETPDAMSPTTPFVLSPTADPSAGSRLPLVFYSPPPGEIGGTTDAYQHVRPREAEEGNVCDQSINMSVVAAHGGGAVSYSSPEQSTISKDSSEVSVTPREDHKPEVQELATQTKREPVPVPGTFVLTSPVLRSPVGRSTPPFPAGIPMPGSEASPLHRFATFSVEEEEGSACILEAPSLFSQSATNGARSDDRSDDGKGKGNAVRARRLAGSGSALDSGASTGNGTSNEDSFPSLSSLSGGSGITNSTDDPRGEPTPNSSAKKANPNPPAGVPPLSLSSSSCRKEEREGVPVVMKISASTTTTTESSPPSVVLDSSRDNAMNPTV